VSFKILDVFYIKEMKTFEIYFRYLIE